MLLFNIFKGKPKIENIQLQRILPKCKEWKIDTLFVSTSRNCSTCKPYNRQIYSLYGWNKKYPKLPTFLYQRKCPDCEKFIGINIFQPGISSEPKR